MKKAVAPRAAVLVLDTRLTTASRLRVGAAIALVLTACDEAPTPPIDEPLPEVQFVADLTGALAAPDVPSGSTPIAAGLFMSSSRADGKVAAADTARQLIEYTNAILEQCDMHLAIEVAQVIELPADLFGRSKDASAKGSWYECDLVVVGTGVTSEGGITSDYTGECVKRGNGG